jgi:hypothetical protein
MKPKNKIIAWIVSDRFLVFFFFIFDLILAFYVRHYLNSINHLSTHELSESISQDRSLASIEPSEKEKQAVEYLVQQARAGSWESFEKTRLEEVTVILQANIKPTAGNAVYLFPETLPTQSFERDFVTQQLIPGINGLKQACKAGDKASTEIAYRRLKSRVENYELGATSDPSQLSEEAKQFLKLYRDLSKL